jgi:hypothetical protein
MVQMLKEVRYGQWRDYNPEEKEQLYPGTHGPMSSTLSRRCRMDRLMTLAEYSDAQVVNFSGSDL